MFNNVKAKKRLTQLIIAFVVICMSVTGSFLLLDDAIESASAQTYNMQVGSGTDWHSAINGKKSGDIVNITLTNSFNAAQLTAIPAGVTVNLDMKGCTISFDNATENVSSIPDKDVIVSDNIFDPAISFRQIAIQRIFCRIILRVIHLAFNNTDRDVLILTINLCFCLCRLV